jgi:tripartite-type tricarboxylate transporter receptor subunit TctC
MKNIALFLSAVFLLLVPPAYGGYPEREIRLIIPWNPGGANDVMARLLQPVLEREGIKIVVENIPGGGTTIGLGQVATAKPDGYTLAFATSAILSLIAEGNIPLKLENFTNLTCISEDTFMLVVPKDSPTKSLKEFMNKIQANPGKVTIGVPSASTLNNLMAILTGKILKASVRNVPYTGASRVVAELMGGQVESGVLKVNEVMPIAKSGDAVPLGSYTVERIAAFPDVPTFKEKGYDVFPFGMVTQMSFAVGPANLPDDIRQKLIKAFTNAVNSPEFKKYCSENGVIIDPVSGVELDKKVKDVTEALRKVHEQNKKQ